nr:RNA-directed DNA polymerase, eukaryota, reverse transcriptase zinc-binding domain protein [Tanacetum cinerariifolium]
MEANDLAQKVNIKWALEGNENTSFLHEVVSFNPFSSCQRDNLDHHVFHNEIKRAFLDYAGDRAPGPNGFTFKFLTTFWDLIEDDVVCFVQEFFYTNPFPKGCNYTFIALIVKVLRAKHYVQPVETSIPAATPKPASLKSNSSGKKRNRKACFVCKSVDHLIKDYDYHAKKMALCTQGPVSAVVPKIMVTRPRLAHLIVTKSKSPIRRHITHSQSPKTSNSPSRVTAVQASVSNPRYALKDKGVIDSGCSRHMTGNMSYLSNFEELNGGYVAFGGNPNGGKISGKGKFKTCKLDFEDVYL